MAGLVREGASSARFQNFVFRCLGDGPGYAVPDRFSLDAWIRGHFRFRPELNEVLRTPDYMLTDLQQKGWVEGDCDDISIFYATILRVLGFNVRFVAIRYSDPENFQHVFIEYDHTGAGWLRADPTIDPGVIPEELERMVQNI